MTREELEEWQEELEAFHARFADLFEQSRITRASWEISAREACAGRAQD